MRLLTILLAALLAITAAGCGGAGGEAPKTGGSGDFAYVKIPFQKVESGQEPPAVADALESMREKGSTSTMVLEGLTYAIITAGMKSSGGWSVTVESVGDSEGKLEVVYRIQAPAPGSINTSAITYPSAVVTFKNPADLPVVFREAK